jgi:UMF1 family MFS transporter
MIGAMAKHRSERAWVLYDVANSAYALIVATAIFPLFYKNVIAAELPGAVSTARLAFASSAFTLVVAVLATVLGPMADYEGRKKRFFAAFFGLGVAATGLLALVPAGQELAVLAAFGLSAIGFAAANVFYDSFLTDVTTPQRLDRVSAAGYAWGYIGSTVPFVIAMALINAGPATGLISTTGAVRIAFVIAAGWWAVFTVPLLRSVRQVHYVPAPGHSVKDTIRDSIRRVVAVLRDLHGHRAVVLFLAAYFFYIDGVGTVIKLATAYGTDLGLSAKTLLAMLLVVQLVAFPCALIYGRLASRREGATRMLLLVGIAVYLVITVVAFAIPRLPEPARVPMFWAISLLVASSQGGIQALSRSYYAALIPAESSAEFFGFYNIFGKFATIVGPLLVGVFAQVTGDTSIGVLSIAVLFLVGGIVLTRVPNPVSGGVGTSGHSGV